MYTVYKRITPDGRVYIGKTQRTLEQRAGPNGCRYYGCKRFYNAILKYGWMNIFTEVLYRTKSSEKAEEVEQFYIRKYDATNPKKGYNTNVIGAKNHVEESNNDQSSTALSFAEKIKKFRMERGPTQKELANLANISQPQICDYENGKSGAHPNNKIALALALRVKPSELEDDKE